MTEVETSTDSESSNETTDIERIEAYAVEAIDPRDANGKNAKFSAELNVKLETAANYVSGAQRNFYEQYWPDVLDTAKREGISDNDCEREFRHLLRSKGLSKYQIYYLLHREQRKLDQRERRLDQKRMVETAKHLQNQVDEANRGIKEEDEEGEGDKSGYVTTSATTSEVNDEDNHHVAKSNEVYEAVNLADIIGSRLEATSAEMHEPKRQGSVVGRKEYDSLKAQLDASQVEIIKLKKQLGDVVVDLDFLIALVEKNESNEELGEKVRIAVRDDPRYKAYVKKQKSKAKMEAKTKKNNEESKVKELEVKESKVKKSKSSKLISVTGDATKLNLEDVQAVQVMLNKKYKKCPECRRERGEIIFAKALSDNVLKFWVDHKSIDDGECEFIFNQNKDKSKRIKK